MPSHNKLSSLLIPSPEGFLTDTTLLAPESPRFRENAGKLGTELLVRDIAAGLALRGCVWYPVMQTSWALFQRGRSFALLYSSRRARFIFPQLRVISLDRLTFCSISASWSSATEILYTNVGSTRMLRYRCRPSRFPTPQRPTCNSGW